MAITSSKGQDGEIRVALDIATLDRANYHAVHNVTVRVDDGTTQIDHVVISKYGIFVIETKNYFGWIFGKEREPKWTRSANGKTESFQNPIRQNIRHIKSLSELLGVEEYLFHSVIAFCGDSEFKTPMPAYVLNTGYADYVRTKKIELFSSAEATALADKLKSSMLARGEETNRIHMESLRQRHAHKQPPSLTPRNTTVEATKGKRGATRGPRHLSDNRLDAGIPHRHQRRSRDRSQQRLAAAIVLVVVLLFAVSNFFDSVKNLVSKTSTPHQVTVSTDNPKTGMEAYSLDRQRPPLSASSAPVIRDASAAPRNSAREKEDAWNRWYSRAPECEVLTDRNMVMCGNKHIRARQEFEQLYALGKVR